MEKRARLLTSTELAPGVRSLDFHMIEPPQLEFRNGQFITVRVGSGRNPNRAYSIASTADRRDGFELLLRLVPDGAASALFERLRPGEELSFSGPTGLFTCLPAHPGDVVFAVTGVGIAAALPLLRETLARTGERGRVRLFWGLRTEQDVFWRERLDALTTSGRFRYEVCLTRPGEGWRGVHGRITSPVLEVARDLDSPVFYLVGNGAMIRELRGRLGELGVDRRRQVREEQFYAVEEP